MRYLFLLICLYISSTQAQNTKNVLFIGNSITYYNSMPQTFESIANSKGDNTSVTMYAPGGTGFINHVNDPNVYAKFREKVWDFVVLQPGSSESYGSSSPIATTLTRALRLKDSILKYSPCAKILYYEISNGVHGSTQNDLNNYNLSMTTIRQNLEFLADGSDLFFAPVGEAFREKWNNDQTDMLWGSTGNIHPNAKGSYIAACVFYASIYQKPSLGTTEISSLSQADATAIQTLVDAKVLDHKSDWRINTWNQYTNFEFQIGGNQVNFTNLSQNVDTVEWDFGDGTTATQTSPTHSYNQIGQFTVSLTTHKGNCDEVVSKQVNITSLSIDDDLSAQWIIYPNPVNDRLYIKTDKNITAISIWTLDGKKIYQQDANCNEIEVNTIPKGIYFIKVIIDDRISIKRILVK